MNSFIIVVNPEQILTRIGQALLAAAIVFVLSQMFFGSPDFYRSMI